MPHRLHSLSDIILVGPLKLNRHASAVEAQAETYCKDLGIYLSNLHEYNTMSAYLFPQTSFDRLFAIIILNNLLFYIDELMDRNLDNGQVPDEQERLHLFKQLIDVFTSGQVLDETDVLQTSALAIRNLFLPLSDSRWLQRFIANTGKHLNATTYDSGLQSEKTGWDIINHYINIREHDSGMVPTVDLIEFAADIYLPDHIMNHDVIQAAMQDCVRACALMNDIFSYHRECMLMGSTFNLIAVVQNAHHIPFEEALDQSIRIINDTIQAFLAKEHQLPHYGDQQLDEMVKDYYEGLKDQIIAAWHWQMSATNRYRSPDSPFVELQTLFEA